MKEYFVDPILKRPWKYLEERFMLKFKGRSYISEDFVWSERLGEFWPAWLVRIAAKNFVAKGHLCYYKMNSSYTHNAYELTEQGLHVLNKYVEYKES